MIKTLKPYPNRFLLRKSYPNKFLLRKIPALKFFIRPLRKGKIYSAINCAKANLCLSPCYLPIKAGGDGASTAIPGAEGVPNNLFAGLLGDDVADSANQQFEEAMKQLMAEDPGMMQQFEQLARAAGSVGEFVVNSQRPLT